MKRTSVVLAMVLSFVVVWVWAGEKHSGPPMTVEQYEAKLKSRAWLGVEFSGTEDGNLQIVKVFPGSPAEAAGFSAGDVFLMVNGLDVTTEKASFMKALSGLSIGSEVVFVVDRDGKVELTAVMGPMPPERIAKSIAKYKEKLKQKQAAAAKEDD